MSFVRFTDANTNKEFAINTRFVRQVINMGTPITRLVLEPAHGGTAHSIEVVGTFDLVLRKLDKVRVVEVCQ
jgi:hypothetical protein